MDKSQVKYGQELGPNLLKVAKKLTQNKELAMLLENTDLDPLILPLIAIMKILN